MSQPTKSDVHVNKPLTNISIAYLQDQTQYISAKVFPNVPVQKQSDVYFKYDKGEWHNANAKPRAPGTESAGTGYTLSNDTYFCKPFALHKDVPDQLRQNADQPLDMDRDATLITTRSILLTQEKNWMTNYFTTGVWGTDVDVSMGTQWSASGSTPISTLCTYVTAVEKSTGFKPNTLVISNDVWAAIRNNADFLDRISVTVDKIMTTDLLARLIEVERVFVSSAVENTAKEGLTASMNWLSSKGAMLCYAAPNPGLMAPSAGYTFSWSGLYGAGDNGLRTLKFRMQNLASDRVESEMAYDQKLVASDLGVFFHKCIA